MKPRHQYDIAFVGLKQGVHHFGYDIDNRFFEARETKPDFGVCQLQVNLTLDKQPGFFLLKFEVTGAVEVICDRCGDPFMLDIWDEFPMVVKLVDDPDALPQDEDPDVAYIARTDSHLHVEDWLYEFILLSVPMQRIHPDGPDGQSGCNPQVLARLDAMRQQQEKTGNPIWKDLDQFKNI
ncbi:DUF177 domain-containing protein [Compostibacter hankyongensis]|uniref:DUF177 domain-containing protein n=1 Tax=Compostibacter hankyongensis TaxID=1007089 RepID=A0ABP8FNY7_9BACT